MQEARQTTVKRQQMQQGQRASKHCRDARLTRFLCAVCVSAFDVLRHCSSFLSVYGGTTSDFAALAAAEDPFPIVAALATLVPETQLCSLAQASLAANLANPASPLYKVKPFPSARYSRYVRERGVRFLVLEMKPFVDAATLPSGQVPVGMGWVEVYGEATADEGLESCTKSLAASAALVSAASASMGGSSGSGGEGRNSDSWMRDVGDEAPSQPQPLKSKLGLAAFKPTGAAERAWKEEQARAPPKPNPAIAAAAAAAPILSRNASFMEGLRASPAAAASAASSSSAASPSSAASKLPPSCSTHPSASMLRRSDRKAVPERTFYVCIAKDAAGKPCDTKIYVD